MFSDKNFDEFMKSFLYGDKTALEKRDGVADTLRNVPKNYSMSMRTNAYTDAEGMTHIDIEMPGFDKKEIDVCLENGVLTVSAEKAEEEKDENKYFFRERRMSCSRSFTVPSYRTVEDFKVTYENGILGIVFQKDKPEDKANTRINID